MSIFQEFSSSAPTMVLVTASDGNVHIKTSQTGKSTPSSFRPLGKLGGSLHSLLRQHPHERNPLTFILNQSLCHHSLLEGFARLRLTAHAHAHAQF